MPREAEDDGIDKEMIDTQALKKEYQCCSGCDCGPEICERCKEISEMEAL